jgi:hypothetical protein
VGRRQPSWRKWLSWQLVWGRQDLGLTSSFPLLMQS